jgi:hypothetical protein
MPENSSQPLLARTYAGAVRSLIGEALDEDAVRTLCFDYYPEVWDQLAEAMSRTEVIRRLVNWCHQQRQLDGLVQHIRRLNSAAWAGYAGEFEEARNRPMPPAARGSELVSALPPLIIHPLTPAPFFVGRKPQLAQLEGAWRERRIGLISLVGLGGAGKTAFASRFVTQLLETAADHPDSLFVWSFYENQNVGDFIAALYSYLGGVPSGAESAMAIMLIALASQKPGRHLVVLDGLERMQRPRSDDNMAFGDIEDRLLDQLVGRFSAGLGGFTCLITTRFPVTRALSFLGVSSHAIDVDDLEPDEARELLRRQGVRGNDEDLDRLIEDFGCHALTLDHLAGFLRVFHAGDPAAAARVPQPTVASDNRQERRLARVMKAYQAALSQAETDVLMRISVFRFGSTVARFYQVFCHDSSPTVSGALAGFSEERLGAVVRKLQDLHLVLPIDDGSFTAHPAIRDYFYSLFASPDVVHAAVRRHFSRLAGQPGAALPRDSRTLDLLEELTFHSLQCGDYAGAAEIYATRLGGFQHLAWELGQYTRCIRILARFPQCPDRPGLVWCYRAIGDLAAARRLVGPDDGWWLGMLGCLEGRFAETVQLLVGNVRDTIRSVCRYMTGNAHADEIACAEFWPGLGVDPIDCLLESGCIDVARRLLDSRCSHQNRSKEADEATRHHLLYARLEIAAEHYDLAAASIDAATGWTMTSGSQEHLSQLFLLRGRLSARMGDGETARSLLQEAGSLAQNSGLAYLFWQCQLELADLSLAGGDAVSAARHARMAMHGLTAKGEPPDNPEEEPALVLLGASHSACDAVWVVSCALSLLGEATAIIDGPGIGRAVLERALEQQRTLAHPWRARTEAALKNEAGCTSHNDG